MEERIKSISIFIQRQKEKKKVFKLNILINILGEARYNN